MIANTLKHTLAAILLASALPAAAQLTVRDDVGRTLILNSTAKRIVTLSPSLTEIVYAAGVGDLVVGVDSLSDYPPEAKEVVQIATGAQFSLEQLATVKPDLVLAWREGIRREDVDRITAFGATVFIAQARALGDIPRLLEVIGRMAGRDTSAVVSDFETRLERVRRANAGKPRMSAFLEIWNRPLTTISGNHILSEALEVCRAENVFRELPGAAPKVTWDQVAREDPYVIVGAGSASNAQEFRDNWRIRQALSAVKADRLVYLESDAIQRPTPRTPEGIAQLCQTLDQVRYASARPAAPAPVAGAGSAAGMPSQYSLPAAVKPMPARIAPAAPTPLAAQPAPRSGGTKPSSDAPTDAERPATAAAPTQPRPRPSQYGL